MIHIKKPFLPTAMIQDSLDDFARMIGLLSLEFNDEGIIYLNIEGLGDVYIEHVNESEVLLYMLRQLEDFHGDRLANILKLCHFNTPTLFTMNAGLVNQNHILFSIRFNETDFTVQAIDKAIRALSKVHDQVGSEPIPYGNAS